MNLFGTHQLSEQRNFIFIDLEVCPVTKEPIEVALVGDDGSLILSSMVNPVKNTCDRNAKKGLPDDLLKKAPLWDQYHYLIERYIEGMDVVVWNKDWDEKYFVNGFDAAHSTHCAMKRFDPYRGIYNYNKGNYHYTSLKEAAALCGLSFGEQGHHRAYSDALMTQKIWSWMDKTPIGVFNFDEMNGKSSETNVVSLSH